jgi:predicted CXXCH cytochrome family protein
MTNYEFLMEQSTSNNAVVLRGNIFFDCMMRKKAAIDYKYTSDVIVRTARIFFGVLLWTALLGGYGAFRAQEQISKAKPESAPPIKRHEAIAGKACTDCHKQAVSSKVQCLLAKDRMCVLCHEIPREGGVARLVESPEPICFKCHAKNAFVGSFVHGPSAVGACITCHDPHGGSIPGMLRITDAQMCLGCHADMRARFANARFQHKAAVTRCTDCHSPHSSDQPHILKSAVPGLCGKCHEKIVKDYQTAAVKHTPVTEAPACMNCHDPHTAQKGNLLLADGLDICLKCHDKTVKAGQIEFADIKQLLESKPEHHGPIKDRYCSGCHNPHSSPYFRLLTNNYPKGFYSPYFPSRYDLCFRCHDSGLAKDEHTITLTGFRDGNRNLHFVHVNRSTNGRTCRACHDVHSSVSPKYIGQTVPFGKWKLPIKFVQTKDGGSCESGCHEKQKYDRLSVNSR